MTAFRSFQNGDLPQLLSVYHQHFGSMGPIPRVSAAQFEQAILARSFFDPTSLTVATVPTQGGCPKVVAWSYFGSEASSGLGQPQKSVIGSICLDREADSDLATELLVETLRNINSRANPDTDPRSRPLVLAGLFRDDWLGFAGLDPMGHGFGIDRSDERLQLALPAAGFVPIRSLTRISAATDRYRAAVSREFLQLRRSARTNYQRVMPKSLRRALALSHLDIERHNLVDRAGAILSQIDFWFSDAEAEVMSPATVILDLPPTDQEGKLSSADGYLISAVLSDLGGRGVAQAEAVVESSNQALLEQLSKLSFTPIADGLQWQWS